MRLFLALFFMAFLANAQEIAINGHIVGEPNTWGFGQASISIEGTSISTKTDSEGKFALSTDLIGQYILNISATDYITKRLSVLLEGNAIDLGTIQLEKDFTSEQTDNLITLTDSDLSDDDETVSIACLLYTSPSPRDA